MDSSFGVDEPAAVERIFEWIDSLPKDQPFFLTYLPVAGISILMPHRRRDRSPPRQIWEIT